MPSLDEPKTQEDRAKDLAALPERGFVRDLLAFLRENRKWWLIPILVVLGLLAILVILAGTGLAPLIYPVF